MAATNRSRLSKSEYAQLFCLFMEQPWLRAQEEAFYEMLGLCMNLDEQVLLSDLVRRLTYLYASEVPKLLDAMVSHMIDTWHLSPDTTQVVAASCCDEADSSQLVLQMLKPVLARRGWTHVRLVSRIGRAVGRHLAERPNVVLVDEFVGTGNTISSRVRAVRDHCQKAVDQGRASEFTIRVSVLASMTQAKSIVANENVEYACQMWLNRGITDHYRGEDLATARERMLRLESVLASEHNGKKLPSFGYGGAEALYSMEKQNTPNSVFPILWWPRLSDGSQRNTVLSRWEANEP